MVSRIYPSELQLNKANTSDTEAAILDLLYHKCEMCDVLHYLLDNIFIRFGSKLYRQIVGIPMGTNCAPLAADLFLFYHDRDFMLSL